MSSGPTTQIVERQDILGQLKSLIVSSLRITDLKPGEVPDDQPLLDSGLEIDSVDILQLIVDIERHFGIKLVTGEFDRSAWKNIDSLAAVIAIKLSDEDQS